jgi:hypothetical protein
LKNLLLINRHMMILLLSDTCADSIHDKRLADAYLLGPPLCCATTVHGDRHIAGHSIHHTAQYGL